MRSVLQKKGSWTVPALSLEQTPPGQRRMVGGVLSGSPDGVGRALEMFTILAMLFLGLSTWASCAAYPGRGL